MYHELSTHERARTKRLRTTSSKIETENPPGHPVGACRRQVPDGGRRTADAYVFACLFMQFFTGACRDVRRHEAAGFPGAAASAAG